jgi:hypothetical protein
MPEQVRGEVSAEQSFSTCDHNAFVDLHSDLNVSHIFEENQIIFEEHQRTGRVCFFISMKERLMNSLDEELSLCFVHTFCNRILELVHPLIADVWVQLNRMGADKGRHTYRYTMDKEKVRLLGAWRTEFSYNGWFSRTMVGLTLSSPEWKKPQRWEGLNLAFTFDTREMGEQFDAAFRQAIRLCRKK